MNLEPCHTYATSSDGTNSNASDQSARVSSLIVVSLWPTVSVFHVAALGRTTAVQTSPITPFAVKLDPLWWIGDHPGSSDPTFPATGVRGSTPLR